MQPPLPTSIQFSSRWVRLGSICSRARRTRSSLRRRTSSRASSNDSAICSAPTLWNWFGRASWTPTRNSVLSALRVFGPSWCSRLQQRRRRLQLHRGRYAMRPACSKYPRQVFRLLRQHRRSTEKRSRSGPFSRGSSRKWCWVTGRRWARRDRLAVAGYSCVWCMARHLRCCSSTSFCWLPHTSRTRLSKIGSRRLRTRSHRRDLQEAHCRRISWWHSISCVEVCCSWKTIACTALPCTTAGDFTGATCCCNLPARCTSRAFAIFYSREPKGTS